MGWHLVNMRNGEAVSVTRREEQIKYLRIVGRGVGSYLPSESLGHFGAPGQPTDIPAPVRRVLARYRKESECE